MLENLKGKNVAELRQLAKDNNIKNISKLKKDELIEILEQVLGETEKVTKTSTSNSNIVYRDASSNTITPPPNTSGYKVTNSDDCIAEGILDVLPDGYGFLRGENYLSTAKDVYLSPVQIRRFKLDSGDIVKGISRFKEGEKFPSLIFVGEVNGEHPEKIAQRKKFDELILMKD